jgi:N-acetylmuramoyl-L-alanine amidase
MIIIVKRNNIILIALIFLLAVAAYSLNVNSDGVLPTNAEDKKRTVMLDPGHGGEDPGAVSDYSGLKEKDVNLSIVLNVKQMLEAEGFNVILTREEDKLEYQPETKNIIQKRKEDLTRRKKMMDEGSADIVVSVHLNKFPQTQYFGAQTFYPPNSPESQKLAGIIQKKLIEIVDPNNKREAMLKKEPIIILKDAKTTTTIVECGFLSNPEEEKLLGTKEYQDKLALAIKEGIVKYFEEK